MSKLFSLILGTLLFAACTAETPDSFVGKEYKLQNAPANAEITLGFDGKENRFFGKSAINNYFGSYTLDGDKITFGPAGATMMAGPQELMTAEQEYLQFLPTVKHFKLDGEKLTLSGADGKELVFEETGTVQCQVIGVACNADRTLSIVGKNLTNFNAQRHCSNYLICSY